MAHGGKCDERFISGAKTMGKGAMKGLFLVRAPARCWLPTSSPVLNTPYVGQTEAEAWMAAKLPWEIKVQLIAADPKGLALQKSCFPYFLHRRRAGRYL